MFAPIPMHSPAIGAGLALGLGYIFELNKNDKTSPPSAIGGVAGHLNEFRMDQLLPAAGAGGRFRLTRESHVNFRVDFAVGRNGHTVTIGVGEAF